MKASLPSITLALVATAVYALRHRELEVLSHRTNTLRQKSQSTTASEPTDPSAKPVSAFSPQPILSAVRALTSMEKPDEAAALALETVIAALSIADLRALASAALRQPDTSPQFLINLVRLIASAGPGANRGLAFDLLLELYPRGADMGKKLEREVADWLLTDPAASAVWMRQALSGGRITDPKLKKKLATNLETAEVTLAPVANLPRLRTLPDDAQSDLLGAAMRGANTPADIRALAGSVITWPHPAIKDRVFGATMHKLQSLADFPTTIAWIDALQDATPEQKNDALLALAMLDLNAVANIPRNAALILSRTDAASQSDIAARLTASWINADHDATGTWLNSNRTAPWYDAAACEFAQGAARKEPATGFDWALTISDEPLRRKAFKEVMRIWNKDNASAAATYLESSVLPADWKQELKSVE